MCTLEEADYSGKQIEESKMPISLFMSLVSPRHAVPSVSALLCPASTSSESNGEQWGMLASLGMFSWIFCCNENKQLSGFHQFVATKVGGFGFLMAS